MHFVLESVMLVTWQPITLAINRSDYMIGRIHNDGERPSTHDEDGGGQCPVKRRADDEGLPPHSVPDRLTCGTTNVDLKQIELNTTSVGGAGHATIVYRLHRSVIGNSNSPFLVWVQAYVTLPFLITVWRLRISQPVFRHFPRLLRNSW